jgi:hypothetical protein
MILNDGQEVTLRAVFTSRAGNPVPATQVGTFSWTSSDPAIITVTDNHDGTALATTTGQLGVSSVTLRNDFNDDGTEDYQGSIAFDVIAGDVGGVAIAAGVPVSRFDDTVAEVPAEPTPEPIPDPVPETPDTTPPDVFPPPGGGGDGEAPPTNPDEGFPATP